MLWPKFELAKYVVEKVGNGYVGITIKWCECEL